MCRFERSIVASALAFVAVAVPSPIVRAQDSSGRLEVGLGLRFMPTGWFEWSGRAPAGSSALRAYPALGAAPFVDYRLNPYASIGFMPELTLNIIPKVMDYPVSAMIAGSLRVKFQYPGMGFLVPYVLLAPGYSSIFRYGSAGGYSGSAHGFVLGAYGGARVPITLHHSIFAKAGYMHGFQSEGDHDYAPSYLVIAAGWQASL